MDHDLDIWGVIFSLLDLQSQIWLMSTCRPLHSSLYIDDLFDANHSLLRNLSDTVLKQKKFSLVTRLDASHNPKITNVNHLSKLRVLCTRSTMCNCGNHKQSDCGIKQSGFSHLNLVELDTRGNRKITNVAHMSNLKFLQAASSGIVPNNDSGLNLEIVRF